MYHLIATRTMPTTLKGVRELHSRLLPAPQILVSDENPVVCYGQAVAILGNRPLNELPCVLNGMMIAQTGDWTYWISASPKS